MMLYLLQFFSTILLIKYKPYEFKSENIIAFINDMINTGAIILYMIASDYTSDLQIK